jgi:serine/threonine protein kinase
MAQSFLGTKGYLAPEMLQRRGYAKTVDTWALGVIVFVLLCGCLPFDDDSSSIPSDLMVRSKFHLRFPRWAKGLSASAKDLLSHLLDTNPQTRYTAHQALQHPWVQGNSAPKDSLLQSPGRLSITPKKTKTGSPFESKSSDSKGKKSETRSQMTQMISERVRANSLSRPGRHLVRKKSI